MLFTSETNMVKKYERENIRVTDEYINSIMRWITERDIKILMLLLKEPFLTVGQLEMMIFNDLKISNWRNRANDRIRRLYHAHCIDRFFPDVKGKSGSSEQHLILDYAGARAIAKSKGYSTKQFKWRKRTYLASQYKHYSKILDFKALLHVLNRQLGFTDEGTVGEIIHWNTQKRYNFHFQLDNKVNKGTLLPDAFCIYKHTGTGKLKFFFLECDNATEPIETLKSKLHNYRRFHASGEWRQEKWARALNVFPAILFVFHHQEQVDEMVAYSRRLNSSLKFLFCTYTDLYVDSMKVYQPNAHGKTRKVVESRYVRILDSIWSSKDGLVNL
jgi:hypothetical protein